MYECILFQEHAQTADEIVYESANRKKKTEVYKKKKKFVFLYTFILLKKKTKWKSSILYCDL